MEILILCLRPLPAANGGWSSAKWRTPKLAAPVTVKPVADWPAALAAHAALGAPLTPEVTAVLAAPFVTSLRMEAPATAFELAIAYAGVVAEACSGVVILGDELIADRRASVAVWSGPQIEERWRAIDAEAAKADPAYQPVRGATDDHRPTQSFPFPIVIDGQEITKPTSAFDELDAMPAISQSSRATKDLSMEETTDEAFETIEAVLALPPERPPGERRASGSSPPTSGRRITVDFPPLTEAAAGAEASGAAPSHGEAQEGSPSRTAAGSTPPLNEVGPADGLGAAAPGEDDWSDVMPD